MHSDLTDYYWQNLDNNCQNLDNNSISDNIHPSLKLSQGYSFLKSKLVRSGNDALTNNWECIISGSLEMMGEYTTIDGMGKQNKSYHMKSDSEYRIANSE